jgi:hypothetical protein
VAAAVALVAFAVVERRVRAPVLPPGTLRDPQLVRALVVALALTASTTPAMLLSVLDRGGSAVATGLACLPFSVAVIAGSLIAGRVRPAPRLAMAGGLAVVAVGAMTLPEPGYVLMGAGLAFASVASTASGTSAQAPAGLASGLLNAAAQIGPALGLALVTSYPMAAAIALTPALAALRSAGPSLRRRAA